MRKLIFILSLFCFSLYGQDTIPIINNGIPVLSNGQLVYTVVNTVEVTGLLNFDGIDDYVEFNFFDITGDETISFNYYTTSTDAAIRTLFFAVDIPDDRLFIYQENEYLNIQTQSSSVTGGIKIDLTSYLNQILEFEIIKTTGSITSVTINDVSVGVALTSYISKVGSGYYYVGRSDIGNYLSDAYIWNLTWNSKTVSGQPNGNQNSAWSVDSRVGTVYGSPSTIDIQ